MTLSKLIVLATLTLGAMGSIASADPGAPIVAQTPVVVVIEKPDGISASLMERNGEVRAHLEQKCAQALSPRANGLVTSPTLTAPKLKGDTACEMQASQMTCAAICSAVADVID